jgi:hypothetical protein
MSQWRSGVLLVLGVVVGGALSLWLGGLITNALGPHGSFDSLLRTHALTALMAAAVLCPLLGWGGWRMGRRLSGAGRRT